MYVHQSNIFIKALTSWKKRCIELPDFGNCNWLGALNHFHTFELPKALLDSNKKKSSWKTMTFWGLIFPLFEYRTLVQNLLYCLVFKWEDYYFLSIMMFPILRGNFHLWGYVHPALALSSNTILPAGRPAPDYILINSKAGVFLKQKIFCFSSALQSVLKFNFQVKTHTAEIT